MIRERNRIRKICFTALMTALICVCSWLSVPTAIPFTMQTFAVFCSLLLLGGKNGTTAIGCYLLMGTAGLPVFSGFRGGIGHLLGPTGGYAAGFLLTGCVYILSEPLIRTRKGFRWAALFLGLLICYASGTVWLLTVCAGTVSGFTNALSIGVLPYILPDCVKLVLAVLLCDRLSKTFSL